jgi:opacity protein-like surface antigen
MNKKLYSIIVAFSSLIATSSFAATPCKAYIKLDLGYGMTSGTKAYGPSAYKNEFATIVPYQTSFAPYMDERGMIGDVAVGYAFNDAMRGEISFDFKPKMQTKMPNFILQTQEYGGSAKALYDFNNNTSVTPFVFGGLGALNIKPKIYPYISMDESYLGKPYLAKIDADSKLIAGSDGTTVSTYGSLTMPSKTVMTYQAGFGLAFKASDAVSIDCTYGLGGKTNYQVLVNTATLAVPAGDTIDNDVEYSERFKQIKIKNQMDQSLTLGIRFTM